MFIKIENLSKKFGDEYIFSRVDLMITDKFKVGVVGKNGTGKTTFLNILAGHLKPTRGKITIDPPKSKVIYHSQVLEPELLFPSEVGIELTCLTYLLSQRTDIFEVWKKLNATNAGDNPEYSNWIGDYSDLGGYFYEDRIYDVCKKLKLETDKEVIHLSGGQKTRLQLSKLLIQDGDILLLDEPTNHLDVDGIDLFYNYIKDFKGLVVIVSHDRNLLTQCVERIVEFEHNKIMEYSGNYEYYRDEKRRLKVVADNKFKDNEKKVDQLNEAARSLEDRIKRHNQRKLEVEKNIKTVRLEQRNKLQRTKLIHKKLSIYKDNDKMSANFMLDRQAVKLRANRKNLITRAATINKTPRSKIGWNMKIDFNIKPVESDFVLKIKNVSKDFGEKNVIKDFSLDILRGEKIALVGPNGRGKTTLLRCISGEINDFEGSIEMAPQVKLGYLDQENMSLNYENTVLQEFLSVARGMDETGARSFLHFFLFEGEMPMRKVGFLSEGEKLKLKLAKLLYSKSNLLLLDEPTNHLDIASQEVIEKALKDYEGSIIIVTHDMTLIKGLGIEKIIRL